MRRFLLALFVLSALTAGAQGFVNPQAKMAKMKYERKVAKAKTRGEAVNENARMRLFVTCEEGANTSDVAEALRAKGAKIHGMKAGIILLDIPVAQMETIADTKGVAIVDVPSKVRKKSDVNRKVTQAAEVNDGSAPQLPQAYTGKGVIVGILDVGFDYTHPTFKDKDGNLRIKGVYKPGISTGGDEKLKYTFADGSSETIEGAAFKNPDNILDTLKVKDDFESHGSHCASIAAGSLMSDVKGTIGNPLGGIAPEADLLLVNISDMDDTFADSWGSDASFGAIYDGMLYLETKAAQLKEPMVTSFSFNNHIGWHDGTSSTARLISEYCKDENPLMLCSSNEGDGRGYIHPKINGGDSIYVCGLSDSSNGAYLWGGMKTTKKVKMEISLMNWNTGDQVCRIPVTFESDVATKKEDLTGFYLDFEDVEDLDSITQIVYDSLKNYFFEGELIIACYQAKAQDKNDKVYTYTQLWMTNDGLKQASDEDEDAPYYVFLIKLKPEETTELQAWQEPFYTFYGTADGTITNGTADVSVGDFNTSGDPVSVGAWCANDKVQYEGSPLQDADYDTSAKDDISFFSSYGTDLAGHKHPDVCAPGSNVVAAMNSFDPELDTYPIYKHKGYKDQFKGQKKSRDYYWAAMSGTSMSTPAAAGVVALWLQAANDMGKRLNNEDIKDIIAHSSDTDVYTKLNPERFGAGKINAYKGLLYVLGIETAIPTLSKEQPKDVSFRVAGDMVYADGAEDGTPASIYNLQGVLMSETSIQGGAFSTAGLPKGVYAVQLGKLGSTLIRK